MEKKSKATVSPKAPATRRAAKSPASTKPASKPRVAAAKTPGTNKAASRTAGAPKHEEIARVAFSLFEQSGCRHGHEVEHWLEAESRVSRGMKL